MPRDEAARARVRTWMLAALNTIEPPITTLNVIDLQPGGAPPGAKELRDSVVSRIGIRSTASPPSSARENLVEGRFTAADLLMTTVLRILRTTDLVSQRPTLESYKQHHEARPAFRKALADQMEHVSRSTPRRSSRDLVRSAERELCPVLSPPSVLRSAETTHRSPFMNEIGRRCAPGAMEPAPPQRAGETSSRRGPLEDCWPSLPSPAGLQTQNPRPARPPPQRWRRHPPLR
jgi:hypothetical protein